MRPILLAVLISGCSGEDCAVLAARYADAFRQAQVCVPGQDTCTGSAASSSVRGLPDGGVEISIDMCMNSCGGTNVNPSRMAGVDSAFNAYAGSCAHPMGCLCPAEPDGGWPAYTCKPLADGGGACAP